MGRKAILVIIMMLLIPILAGSSVFAADSGPRTKGKDDGGIEDTAIGKKAKSYSEALEDLFDARLESSLEEEEREHVRKTYMKLYKHSFDGFFLNIKERFSLVLTKFEAETKGCGSILLIVFLITSFIQGSNNKILVGRHLHLYEGKVAERYRYDDGHLSDAHLAGKIVRFATVLEGLMLVAIVFRSDGILFKNLFLLSFRESLWRVVAYGCIRVLISFVLMFIPFVIAYLIALPIAVIQDLLSQRTYERGPTFHSQALDMLENRIILGILSVFAAIVFLYVNYVSWFIYLEAAGMFK